MQNKTNIFRTISRLPLWVKMAVAGGLVLALYFGFGRGTGAVTGTTFTARRGPLEINVLVGGSMEALESQDIKCEVRGYWASKF